MATKLDKDIIRESTQEVDERNIMITLTKDQEVSMKLKGMKSGAVSIGIDELYGQLTGEPVDSTKENKGALSISTSQHKAGSKGNPMISLHDLRSQSAIAGLDYQTMSKFDGIIKNLIESNK